MHSPRPGINLATLALSLWLASGCAEDLTLDTKEAPVEPVVTEPASDGTFTTIVDASDNGEWVYFSFQSGDQVIPADPASSSEWDLAFQRFHILSNGGVSGSGGAAVATLVGRSFDAVLEAPIAGYVEDQPDSDDSDSLANSAFEQGDGWYDYDEQTNRLSPREHVYVVRTGRGSHYKLSLLGYYDGVGSSGHPSFRWTELPLTLGPE